MAGNEIPMGNLGIPTEKSSLGAQLADGARELAEFKNRLGYLRGATILVVVCHCIATLFVMVMGFQVGIEREYMSPSIVVCAFGCFNTCIFAIVDAYKTFQGTQPTAELSSWKWHNQSFLEAVGNVFFLSLFVLPAVVIYMLHSKGKSFFTVMTETRTEKPEVYDAMIFHIIAGVICFLVDALFIARSTRKLHTFQQDEEENEKTEKQGEQDEDREETRKVSRNDRLVATAMMLAHILYFSALVTISAQTKNSGPIVSGMLFGSVLLYFIFYVIKHRRMTEVTEGQLLSQRLAVILDLFLFLLTFWVALCVLVLNSKFDSGFYETLHDIAPVRAFQASIVIIIFCVYVAGYAVILYVHSRSMWSLDEIASLYLATTLAARIREERD